MMKSLNLAAFADLQLCAPSTFVHNSLGDELFWLKVGFSPLNCKLGDPFDPETDQGPSGAYLQFKF